MKEGLLDADGRVRRVSTGNLLEDPEDSGQNATLRAAAAGGGATTSAATAGAAAGATGSAGLVGSARVDIEDVFDLIGGFGRYQFWHLLATCCFWALNVSGTPISVFANSPWCVSEDNPALCLQGDDQLQPAPFWSPCRSLSCQFNLRPALCLGDDDGTGTPCSLNADATGCLVDAGDCTFTPEQDTYLRPLFDSSFFLGWMWSVPLFGWLSDRKGRKVALLCAYTVLMCSTAAAAFATSPTFYLIARHFNGVGIGSQSMSAYVLGTELAPRKTATKVKAWWAVFSNLGNLVVALWLRSLLFLPGYNWRMLTLVSVVPNVIIGIFCVFCVDESPRWVLINRGEAQAKQLLRKIAIRNDRSSAGDGSKYLAVLDQIELRVPPKTKQTEAAYQMFLNVDLCWRMLAICVLWFASGFAFYGLTLGVNALPFDRYYVTAIFAVVEFPTRIANQPLLDSRLGRKYGILMLLFLLAAASVTAMFWTTDIGRTTLNIFGRAMSGASFIAIYVWSTELLPTSVRQGGMSIGSFAARVGSVAAPWAAQIGALLPVPENLATDVSLLLFGGSAIIAIIIALLVLPETKGLSTPETIADAVLEMQTKLKDANKRAHQVAVVLGQLIAIGISVLLGFVVAAAISDETNRQAIIVGASSGTGSALLLCGSIGLCYWLR